MSRAVAFEGLLRNGERFAQRVLRCFRTRHPQLANIATDGETYGHHHRHGEMALAYALHHVERGSVPSSPTTPASSPPTRRPTRSRSRSEPRGAAPTGSSAGVATAAAIPAEPGWHQQLAQAAAGRAGLAARRGQRRVFEDAGPTFCDDPWDARDDYIGVMLDRRRNTIPFLAKHPQRLTSEVVTVLELMELQRHAMLMYTSCGWFFNDVSGIETVQVLQYAGRVVQLAERLFGESLQAGFLERLELAKSNLPRMKNARAPSTSNR
jgi:hypothetical protein